MDPAPPDASCTVGKEWLRRFRAGSEFQTYTRHHQCRMCATVHNSQNHQPSDAACRECLYTLMVSLATLLPSGANMRLGGERREGNRRPPRCLSARLKNSRLAFRTRPESRLLACR
jgi:hypothetical protein